MGATKRCAEEIVQSFAARSSAGRYSMVRFGNVLGSSGSVVPLFRRQIEAGGPITLTHRDVTRYFMTIPEAANLVIQAGGLAKGGEVFVLDMGNPVRIYDLARTMVQLSGLSVRDAQHPEGDIEIVEVGLRPGEKLFEELLIGECPARTKHPRIMKAVEECLPAPDLSDALSELRNCRDSEAAITILKRIVPGYHVRLESEARLKSS
jgi:FlaA1/EpsC-like NDP-sugar epimerase